MLNENALNNIENNINNYFKDKEYNLNNLQVFIKITNYSYYPVKFSLNENNEIKIKNDENFNNNSVFYIGSKKQFLYKQYTIPDDTNSITLDEYFRTGWNPEKFLIFLNGYLINNNLLIFIIPNFDNEYKYKKIFSTISLKENDRLDIYYIESDDNFNKVPLLSNNKLNQVLYIAQFDDQTLIEIPYIHNKENEFYVFNENGKYLQRLTDYIVSKDGNYIILSESNKLEKSGYSSLYFTFSSNKFINNSTYTSSLKFVLLKSEGITQDGDGTVTFNKNYIKYNLNVQNCLLFNLTSNTFIPYEHFKIISNDDKLKIKINNTYSNDNYCLYIFEETDNNKNQINPVHCNISTRYVLQNNQQYIDIPSIEGKYLPFILLYKNVILGNMKFNNEEKLFEVDNVYNNIKILDPSYESTRIEDGNIFLFLSLLPRLEDGISTTFEIIEFLKQSKSYTIRIPDKYKYLNFHSNESESNFLFFVNNINIPNYYFNSLTSSGNIIIKSDYKKLYPLNKINSNNPVKYTILYLKDSIYIDPSIYNRQDSSVNIQFKEVKKKITTYK